MDNLKLGPDRYGFLGEDTKGVGKADTKVDMISDFI